MKDIKKLKSWSNALAKTYGKTAAEQFAVGIEDYIGYIIEAVCQLQDIGNGATLNDIPDALLAIHLPSHFLQEYTLPFIRHLSDVANSLRDRFANGDLTVSCVADEVVLRGAASCSIVHFESEADSKDKTVDEKYLDASWIYEIAEDDDIEMLFDEEEDPAGLDPEYEYYYFPENWFKNYYTTVSDKDLRDFIEKLKNKA